MNWQRPDARMVAVHLAWLLPPIGSALIAIVFRGELDLRTTITLASLSAVFVCLVLIGILRWLTTRYRVTDDLVELHSGLVFRRHRSIPRDRVRSVDQTANPVHRLLGLAVLKVGTAEHRELTIEGVPKAQADDLRRRLLERAVVDDSGLIASLSWRWIRYAPMTVWVVGGVAAVAGTIYKPLHEMGFDPVNFPATRAVVEAFLSVPLWIAILVSLLVIAALGTVGSLALFVEGWWGYRLEREPGVLRVRRGLVTTRSVSLERERLRGVELTEPMVLRWAGGAHAKAVAVGLAKSEETESNSLGPPMPRAEALRVTESVVGRPWLPTVFHAHPRAALRRRLLRFLLPVVVTAGVLAVWFPVWAVVTVMVGAVIATAFGIDSYRSLGHAVAGGYLVIRRGTFIRRTVALRADGVIGWTASRSIGQRWAGLVTLTATTAAGHGAYRIRDVRLDEDTLPGQLRPFVRPE